ncbi:hypothetical protein UFOVP574_28 [uncultured Caudovirales phage]|uniref:Uncharacterized protein n=1 Tax=uncultured Caudovirales phage TaxID=2100421 RepID=A0A6J5MUA6_9CAUD|nr:hypothetical protein UFOVP574_28 [uncultured Caudovirales phage]
MATLKNLQEVANTAPGSYISGGFQAVVSKVKQRAAKATGKIFYSCSLTEGNLTIAGLSDRDVTALEGKLVKFMGMGIKRGNDYNNVAQVNIGDKTTILAVEGGAIPVASIPQPSVVTLPHVVAPAPASTSRIEGVTVGMAINKAVDICIKTGEVTEENLWHWSSSLIRLAQKLQAGNLAPETSPEIQQDEQPY